SPRCYDRPGPHPGPEVRPSSTQGGAVVNRRRYASSVAAVAVLAAAVAAPAFAQSPSAATGRIPDKLILGLVPSADANVLITNAQPLADYLTQAVGIPTESLVPTDYTALV